MDLKIKNISNFLEQDFEIKDIRPDTPLIDEGYIDSMQILELVIFIEAEYDINIEADDMRVENFQSLNAIIEFIGKKNIC